jgi:hypothetical protein
VVLLTPPQKVSTMLPSIKILAGSVDVPSAVDTSVSPSSPVSRTMTGPLAMSSKAVA